MTVSKLGKKLASLEGHMDGKTQGGNYTTNISHNFDPQRKWTQTKQEAHKEKRPCG